LVFTGSWGRDGRHAPWGHAAIPHTTMQVDYPIQL
jgi:hypothetical protein